MALTSEEYKELALLARESGDEALEMQALEGFNSVRQSAEPEQQPFDLESFEPGGDIGVAESPQDTSVLQDIEKAFQSIPGAPQLSELAAGGVRSLAGMVDFFGPDNINAALKLSGSDKRVPTLTGSITVPKGSFVGEGLQSDILSGAGEASTLALGLGQVLRQAAQRLPAFSASESTGVGVTRQLGASTPAQDIAIGAASGGGAEIGADVGGETGRLIGSLATPLVPSAAIQTGRGLARGFTGQIAPEAQATITAGERAGIPVLTTDVIPPKGIVGGLARQFGERIPFLGTSGKRAAQQSAREAAVSDVANSLQRTSSDDIVASLKSQVSKVKKAAGNRLEGVQTRMDELGEVPLVNAKKTIDNSIQKLTSVKIEQDTATIQKLKEISEGASEAHTFGMLRDARTAVREAATSADPLIRSQLPSKSKTALKSVERAITKDLDNFVESSEGARGLARYKEADRVWANEATKLTKSRLKNVLDKGEITPEIAEAMILSRKPSEVKLIHDSLTAEGKQAGRVAIINSIIAKSGTNPTRFSNELDKVSPSVDVFFKGKDKTQLKGLKKLLAETKRAQEAPVVTPTGQSLTALVGVGAGSQIGLIESLAAASSAGAAARIYESVPVRNFLLRLANTPRTSPRFKKLIDDSLPQITTLIQAEGE